MLKVTKNNYYMFALGIGASGLGLALYNHYKTKKYRETMLGLQMQKLKNDGGINNHEGELGGIFQDNHVLAYPNTLGAKAELCEDDECEEGVVITNMPSTLGSPIDTIDEYYDVNSSIDSVSAYSEKYSDRGTELIQNLLTSDTFINTMKEAGISIKPESINKAVIKNILSALGLWYLFTIAKGNALKIGVAGVAGYLALQNKDKLNTLINQAVSETELLTA